MAKKYLLYIHRDDLFDKENNKSELINKLLEAHYAPKKVGVGVNIQESQKIKKDKIKMCKKGHLFKGDKCIQKDCV